MQNGNKNVFVMILFYIGAANVIQGVHTWNLATKLNGTGILIESHSIRLLDCYLDYNDLVLVAPIFMMSVENTFFSRWRYIGIKSK